jgi:hypothetical protein
MALCYRAQLNYVIEGRLDYLLRQNEPDMPLANLILRDPASLCGFSIDQRYRAGLQLTRAPRCTFDQTVFIVESILNRHAPHPVSRIYRSTA